MKKQPEQTDVPVMPFNEALKRVWSAKPMPKVKPKPAAKPAQKKPGKSA